MAPEAFRPSQVHDPVLPAVIAHFRTVEPRGPTIRAVPLTVESAAIRRRVVSLLRSPFGEIEFGEADPRMTAGFVSRVTTLVVFARLFEASIAQIQMRYGPSGSLAPFCLRPSH